MKILCFFSILALLCSGCSENPSSKPMSENLEAETEKTDTTVEQAAYIVEYDKELVDLIKKFDTINFKQELNGNSIDSLPRNYALKSKELTTLSQNFMAIGDYIVTDYYIKAVSKIIDAKRKGKLEDYQNTIDIGGTYNGNAYALSRFKINDSTEILTTKVQWESYPACPSGNGTELLLTLIYDGKVAASTLIAYEHFGSAPPVFGESFLDYKIRNDKTLILQYLSRSGEYSDDGDDIIDDLSSEKYELILGKTISISENKAD